MISFDSRTISDVILVEESKYTPNIEVHPNVHKTGEIKQKLFFQRKVTPYFRKRKQLICFSIGQF